MIRDPYSWGGPSYPAYAGELKGSGTTQAAEHANLAFTQELQKIFIDQYNNQRGVLNFLKGRLEPGVNNPQGFAPAALAAMRAQATDTIATQFQHAEQALNQKEQTQGGANLPSGVNSQLDAALLAQEAEQQSAASNNITLQNEQQRQANYWRAVGALSGTASELNPLGYASGETASGNAGANLSEANTTANKSGFGGSFANALGSSLGAGIGSDLTGGHSTNTSGSSSAAGFFGF